MQAADRVKTPWSDQQIESVISTLLRVGVGLAALLVFAGGVMYLIEHGRQVENMRTFHGEPAALRSISGIVAEATHGHSQGLIQLGLLVLIATPVARVAFAVFAFAKERDWLYVAVTVIVLSLLLYSLIAGGL